MANKLIVCDAGPLIALAKIDHLAMLKQLFHEVFVPEGVIQECLVNPNLPGAKTIKKALDKKILLPKSPSQNSFLEPILKILDEGERLAILLAQEINATLLLDEKRGRSVARNLAIPVIGTAGLLLMGFKKGLISNLPELLEYLKTNGYRLADNLIEEILKRARQNQK